MGPENKNMVNKGEKTEITTLKCHEKVRKNVFVRSEKIWKKVPKVRKNGIFDKSEKEAEEARKAKRAAEVAKEKAAKEKRIREREKVKERERKEREEREARICG